MASYHEPLTYLLNPEIRSRKVHYVNVKAGWAACKRQVNCPSQLPYELPFP